MTTFYQNVPVLVTGGAGFIGSHVATKLVELGATVTVLDNFSSGNLDNIAHLENKITIIEGDIRDYPTCIEAVAGKKIIFHLAADVSVPGSVDNPRHCFETNVMGTVHILEAARHHEVRRVVFSSSSAVYGVQDGLFIEDETACKPESPYGLSKLQGEDIMRQFYDIYGVETVSLRYFNVYGDRQDPNSKYAAAVAKFKDNMRHNKPLVFYGDGKQTRDFVPVEYVAEANCNLGMLPAKLVCGRAFNIASGKSIDLFELAETLKKEFPLYSAGIEFAPPRPGDVKHTAADCTAYKDVVKYCQQS